MIKVINSKCFALQYNHSFKGKKIPAQFSAIEYHSLEDIEAYASSYPADRILHLSGFLDKTSREKYWHREFLEKVALMNIKLFSFDCGPSAEDVTIRNGVFVPIDKKLCLEDIEKRFTRHIKQIRRYYRGLIAIENLNYYPSGAYEYICRPEIIKRLAEANNVLILLDIAHLLISSYFFKMHPLEYFNALPKERIIHIHLSRPINRNGYLIDKHFLPLRKERELLAKMLKSISPAYLTVEYCRDKNKLLREYGALGRFLDYY